MCVSDQLLDHPAHVALVVDRVLVGAAEVLAVALEPRGAVAPLRADVRQHAVAEVLVQIELSVVSPARVVIDAADGARALHAHRVVGALAESGSGGEKAGDEAGKQLLAHLGLPLSREELAAGTRRIRAVDLAVAVNARASD